MDSKALQHRRNIYDGHEHTTSASTLAASSSSSAVQSSSATSASSTASGDNQQIKSEPIGTGDMQQQQQTQQPMVDIKQEPVDGDGGADGKVLIESLYTSKGLAPSYNDLEQLFDEDNSDASPGGVSDNLIFYKMCLICCWLLYFVQVHTPPRSNKSFGGSHDDSKRYISLNNQPMNLMELTKMFPTPPSLEQHHPSSSPCGGPSDHQLDHQLDSPNMLSNMGGSGGGNGGMSTGPGSGYGDDDIEVYF